MNERTVIPIAGKHPDSEEAILLYLYENPEGQHSTNTLASVLEDKSRTPEEIAAEIKKIVSDGVLGTSPENDIETAPAKRQRKPADVQTDIESLIVKGLLSGTRKGKPGNITHADIKLTTKGEREAIESKKRDKELVFVVRSIIDEDTD